MFKVGDRVKYVNQGVFCTGWLGTIKEKNGDLYLVLDKPGPLGRSDYLLQYEVGNIELYTEITYKPGDKLICKRAVRHTMWVGMIGEYRNFAGGYHHSIWPNEGIIQSTDPSWYELYTAPAPRLSCARCHEPNDYAEPNLPGGGYACFSCRKYHAYALTGT